MEFLASVFDLTFADIWGVNRIDGFVSFLCLKHLLYKVYFFKYIIQEQFTQYYVIKLFLGIELTNKISYAVWNYRLNIIMRFFFSFGRGCCK